jgi:hypothetical protein
MLCCWCVFATKAKRAKRLNANNRQRSANEAQQQQIYHRAPSGALFEKRASGLR